MGIERLINEYGQWGLALAGASDFTRPAESLSLSQNLALSATGAIWTRWCFVIKPRNILYDFLLPQKPSRAIVLTQLQFGCC